MHEEKIPEALLSAFPNLVGNSQKYGGIAGISKI